MENDIMCSFSGGGYRATFFHAGVLRKLIAFGLKDRIKVISSVSGGSIINAFFSIHFDEIQSVKDFDQIIIEPLIEFSRKDIRTKILLYKGLALLRLKGDGEVMVENLQRYLFHDKKLNELSPSLHTVINATNLNNGGLWQFGDNKFGDSETGYSYDVKDISLAFAVAASACFPGLLSPMKLDIQENKFYHQNKENHDDPSPCVTPDFVYLADGGVFDNLGYFPIEQALRQDKQAVFVISDAASRFKKNQKKYHFLNEPLRIVDVLMEQVSSRDRKIIMQDMRTEKWRGVYMKLENSCRFYRELEGFDGKVGREIPVMGWSDSIVERIGKIRTDLNAFSQSEIQALICHGETLVETTIAKWRYEFYQKEKNRQNLENYVEMAKLENEIFEALERSKEFIKL